MKFTKGYWMNRPGVEISDVMQIREAVLEEDRLYLYTVPYGYDGRAMGGSVIEIYISAPLDNIIRTEAWHFMGGRQKEPAFDLHMEKRPLRMEENGNTITVYSGDTSLVITKNPASFTYYYKGRRLTSIGERFGHAMISTIQTDDGPFMRAQMDLDIGEKVYGLGERFTPFVKNGQVIDMWNEDGGTCTEISYKNIPFYLTNKGYGVFVNSSDAVSYEICSEMVTRVQFSLPGEKLDFMVIGGADMKDVLSNYCALTGRPSLPPAWSFGLWLTSSFTTSYDEQTVNSFVDGMAERNIPLHVFHFDCYWMRENEWCGFRWDKNVFPDVEGMLSRMHEKGLKICVWINPYIGQKSPLFREAMDAGYLLHKPNGDIWQTDLWQAGMGIVDFTNPGAWKWYQDKLRTLLHQGVDCFKTDFGERIPTDVVYHDGSDPVKMHNYYTYLYNKCVYDLLAEERGEGDACLFARSATVGGQKFPVHWGGDCSSNYPSMNESLRAGLSLCMSGFGFWSHDISGFEGTAPADVYKRWAAFGLLSTHSRLHGSGSYRVPWLFGEEAVDVLRAFTELKCSLMPYLYTTAVHTHETGVPVMRAMVLEFQKDRTCADLESQYMLGDSLLVAPVMDKDGDVEYYLPEGVWTNFFTGETVQGGTWRQENYDFFSLPLLVRENTILPVGADTQRTEYVYTDGLTLRIYQLRERSECVVCDVNGRHALGVTAIQKNGQVRITLDGKYRDLRILLCGVHAVTEVSGGQTVITEDGVLIKVEADVIEYRV